MKNYTGRYCVVRSYDAGVFVGRVVNVKRACERKTVDMEDVIRIHCWYGAASLSQLAMEGVKSPKDSRFAMPVLEMTVENVIEIIPCTEVGLKNIREVPTWKM